MQMFLSTILLIAISSIRTSNSSASQSKEDTSVDYPHRRSLPQSPKLYAHPSPVSVYTSDMPVVVNPTIFYPVHLPVTSRGKTQIPLLQNEKRPKPPPETSDETDRISNEDEEVAIFATDRPDVPLNLTPFVIAMNKKYAQQQPNGTHFSDSETHGEQISNSTSDSDEVNDNAIGVEHLPTIAVPFLDTLAHGIINGVHQHVQLIKPGTKWCGEGNKARHYDDVGLLHKTDKCCRNHDRCPYYILSHETKFGLHNDAHFTRSHCDCDASFYDCLKRVNSPFSHGVGVTYFNILRMRCFRLEYPVVMCAQSTGWFSKHCVEYIVHMGKRKQWQWFDNHEF